MGAEIHKPWVTEAVEKGLARFDAETVTVNNIPEGAGKVELPYNAPVFQLTSAEDLAALWAIGEKHRGTKKDSDGKEIPGENFINAALSYALGLNGRSKTRVNYESQFVDPESGVKKMAAMLVKQNPKRYNTTEKAMAAARLYLAAEEAEEE